MMRRKGGIVGESGVRPSSLLFSRRNPEGDIMRRAYLGLGEILIILVTSLQSVIKRIVDDHVYMPDEFDNSPDGGLSLLVWTVFFFLLHAPRTCERK